MDDEELQDETLQIKLWDHDLIGNDNSIGQVRCLLHFPPMHGVAVSQQIPTQHIQAITQALRHRIIHHIVSTLSLPLTSLLSEFWQPLTNRDFPSGSDVFS